MNENIFQNVNFGDKFIAKNGKVGILLFKHPKCDAIRQSDDEICIAFSDSYSFCNMQNISYTSYYYWNDGVCKNNRNYDIISHQL